MPNDLHLLRDQAYQALLDLIISGELGPDEPLSERKLADRLDMGRTPVREALRRLVRDGVIVSQLGRGTFVRSIGAGDVRAVYEVRLALEGTAATLAARNGPSRSLVEIGIQLAYMHEHPDNYSAAEIDSLGERFHHAIFESASNPILLEVFEPLRLRFQIAFGLTRHHERRALQDTLPEHLRILRAIEQRDETEALAAMKEHLERGQAVRMKIFDKSRSTAM